MFFSFFTDIMLQKMSEIFIKEVKPETWPLITERLGLSRDTMKHIEIELPGEFNFRNRVRRSMEYWTGLNLSSTATDYKSRMTGDFTIGRKPSDETEYVVDLLPKLSADATDSPTSPTGGSDIVSTVPFIKEKAFIPTISGPKASPERFCHVLRLLRLNELAEAVYTVFESERMHFV